MKNMANFKKEFFSNASLRISYLQGTCVSQLWQDRNTILTIYEGRSKHSSPDIEGHDHD